MSEIQGLAGVTAGETAISTVGKSGVGLTYRGYDIHDLANHSSFEAVAYLLIYGEYPDAELLKNYQEKLAKLRTLPSGVLSCLKNIPETANPMDVLRTGISLLGTLEPEDSHAFDKIVAVTPQILLTWLKKQEIKLNEKSTAVYFLKGLQGNSPDPFYSRALDISLILYAEHEFNASTFAARVTASTLSDIYSCITTGIGTLRGVLHGGANEEAMKLIQNFSDVNSAEQGVKICSRKRISQKII
jgi:2-methylcitrate synthase